MAARRLSSPSAGSLLAMCARARARNTGATRLAEKPSKRDLAWSADHVREMDDRYRLNSIDEFAGRDDHLLIDNTWLSPDEVAKAAIEHFGL